MDFLHPHSRLHTRRFLISTAVIAILLVTILLALNIATRKLAQLRGKLAPMLTAELRQTLGRDVRIGSVQIRGFDRIVIHNAAVAKGSSFAEGTALTVPETTARLDIVSLLLNRETPPMQMLQRVTLTHPQVEVNRSAQGRWDFQDVIDRIMARGKFSKGWHAQIVVAGGQMTYRDARGFGNASSISKDMREVDARITPLYNNRYAFNIAASDVSRGFSRIMLDGSYATRSGITQVNLNTGRISATEITRFFPKDWPITFTNGAAALRLSALIYRLPNPAQVRHQSQSQLTVEVSLKGMGLRLRELASPVIADSGTLRLVHDPKRYPLGSRLELHNMRAHAANVPFNITGAITEINLFDLAHSRPRHDISVQTAVKDGRTLVRLFTRAPWLRPVTLDGKVAINAHLTGHPGRLRIDGDLNGNHIQLPDLDGKQAAMHFRLWPGAVGKTPTLQADGHMKTLTVGSSTLSDLAIYAQSRTPWANLEDTLVVTGNASASRIQASWGEVTGVRSKFTANRQQIQLHALNGGMFGGMINGSATIPFQMAGQPDHDHFRTTLNYTNVDLRRLMQQAHVSDITGIASGTITLVINNQGAATLQSNLKGPKVTFSTFETRDLAADLRMTIDSKRVIARFPQAIADTKYGKFTITDGSYTQDSVRGATAMLRLPLHSTNVPLQSFGYEVLTGTAVADGILSGDPHGLELTAKADGKNIVLSGRHFSSGSSDVYWHGDTLALRNLTLANNGLHFVVAGGPNGFDPRKGLDGIEGTLYLHGAPLDDVLALADKQSPWKIDGGTEGTLQVKGLAEGVSVSGTAAITHPKVHIPLADDEYPLQLDRLAVNFALLGQKAQINDLQLDRGKTILHAHGTAETVPNSGDIRADIDFTGAGGRLDDYPHDLFGIPVALSGGADVTGSLHGVLNGQGSEPLRVAAKVDAPQFSVAGLSMGRGAADLSYDFRPQNRQLIIHRGTVNNAAFDASMVGDFALDRGTMTGVKLGVSRIDLAGVRTLQAKLENDFEGIDLSGLGEAMKPLKGTGSAEMSLNGAVRTPDLRLSFDMNHLGWGTMPLPDLRGALASEKVGNRYRVKVEELVAKGGAGNMQASVTGAVEPDGKLNLAFAAQDLPLAQVAKNLGQLPLSGTAGLTGTLTGPWRHPVADADLTLQHLAVAGHAFKDAAAHLRVDERKTTLSNAQVTVLPGSTPLTVRGSLPLGWGDALRGAKIDARPLTLSLNVPKQDLSIVRGFFPALPDATGSVEGKLEIGGTLAAPRPASGQLIMQGSIGLPHSKDFASSLQDVNVQVDFTNASGESRVTLSRFSGVLADKAVPGWVAASGDVRIPDIELSSPDHWRWNLRAQALRLKLPMLLPAPEVNGLFHLTGNGNSSLLQGVVLLENAKLQIPEMNGTSTPSWGPFSFNPRLSLVLQVGEKVKLAKGILRFPLKPTPLPRPEMPTITADVHPSPDMRASTGYDWNAGMLRPENAGELSGTWGTITGSMNDPQLFARFEVDKKKLAFPFSLIGSIRNARGQLTYSMADGAKLVMGDPKSRKDVPATVVETKPVPAAEVVNTLH